MVMQPPANSGHLRGYIEQLKTEARTMAEKPKDDSRGSLDRIDMQVQKISEWVNELPEVQKRQSYGIDAVIRLANLTGMYATYPSHQHIAIALRRSGFTQFRSWKKCNRNKRLWVWSPKIVKDT